jgi:hypothetical protein
MTVRQLVEILMKDDPDRIVILSRDQEGNGFSPLRSFEACKYNDGEVGLEELTPELEAAGYSDEDVMHGGKKALCLWP